MKHLFLTSFFTGTTKLFEDFANEYISHKKGVFIPTAGNAEEYTDFIDEAKEAFENLGFAMEILDVSKVDEEYAANLISDTDFLYVSGGNTFYLLQELAERNLIERIRHRVENGMVYAGESAGAIITSPNIAYSQIMDDKSLAPNLKTYAALGLVDFYVLPHYREYPFEETSEKTLETYGKDLPLITINNHQAVVVHGEAYEVLGEA